MENIYPVYPSLWGWWRNCRNTWGVSLLSLWEQLIQDLLTCSNTYLGKVSIREAIHINIFSDLIYEIELVHAEQGPRHPEVFDLMDTDKNGFLSRNEIFQFVHDELEKQGEMNKITTDEENEMISQILEMEGTRSFKKSQPFRTTSCYKFNDIIPR